jgi:subtilisin-like proprotein convertase family protein
VAIPSVTAGDTSLATFDTGLPATCGTSITTAGVWYKVMGNGNSITVDTCGATTNYDSKISVFCPNCATPACVGGNDDSCGNTGFQSSVTWCSAPGETYLVLVHGFGGSTGPFDLTVTTDGVACANPPSCTIAPICGGGGDCCAAGTGPGCNDVACCELVCGCDPFCCDVTWDGNCAGPNAFVPGCSCLEACQAVELTGGCCLGAGCSIQTASACAASGGTYLGDGASCTGPDVPGNSYTDNPALAIPDGPGGTVSDTMNVPDSFIIGDLNVDLGILHTWQGDLGVTIEHNGTSVLIVDQPGYTGTGFGCPEDNYAAVMCDDEGGGGLIEDACSANLSSPPNYVPNSPLSAFDGMNAQGTWTITVTDAAGFDTGSLEQWSLHFGTPGASACIPSGACCLSPTTCVVMASVDCTGVYLGDGTNCSAAGPVTVYAADPALAIPDNGTPADPATHTITVPDSYTLADVDIDLGITHTWMGDVIVEVEHNATIVVIVDRPGYAGTGFGCSEDNYNGVVIDGQGTGGTIEAACAANLTSPPNYTPNNPLSVFNGMSAAGAWTIRVSDNAGFDTGTLDHWSLHLTQPGAGPCANISVCGNGTVEAGEACDGGACCNADCTFVASGTTCNASAGDCDPAETCSGTSAVCPPNVFSSGNTCRPSTGPCDPAEVCSGNGPTCPPNMVVTSCVGGDGCCPASCNNANDSDCPAVCGNGVVETGEECDGASADACPGLCLPDCTCETGVIPTMSEWGLAVMALLLLIGAKLYFGRREVTA